MRHRALVLLLLAGWLLASARPVGAEEPGELLLPGTPRERPIGAGEAHVYRVEVSGEPVLVTVEQQSIDLVLESREAAGRELGTAAGNGRWGPEILLLEGPGERRIEVRPRQVSGWPGRYSIRVEAAPEGDARRRALALMSRAGQEAFAGAPEARQQATASYRAAAAAWQALGDRSWEAEAVTCLAVLEQEANELRPAAEDHERALALWRELAEPRRQAATLNELGLTRRDIGELEAARAALQEALALWRQLGERFDAAETLSNLCLVEQTVGALPAALACYEEPRAVFREIGDQSDEERILNNLGGIYDLLGEPDKALEHYQQALVLRRALGNHLGEAQTLNNIAVIHRTIGEWQEALRLYGQEREILERFGDRSLQAALLNNVGSTYNSLGEPQRALAFLENALKLRREIGDQRGETVALNNLGITWRKLGEPKKALGFHGQARELAAALGDARQEALTRLRLGEAQLAQGAAEDALRDLAPALVYLREAGLRPGELQALQLQGRALLLAGRPRDALPVLQEVLAGRRTLRDHGGEAEALGTLAAAERAAGLPEEARAHAESAVARVEELRTGFASPDLRAAFLATQRRVYSLLIDLLMDRHAADPRGGWDRVAFAVSEKARARSLLDALSPAQPCRAASPAAAALLVQRQALRRRLSSKAEQQLRQQSSAKAADLGREIDALLADLDSVDAEIRRADPQSAVLGQAQPISPEDLAGLLDPGTLLLEYALGEERSFLWVAEGSGGLRSFLLPPQKEIEALAHRVYGELSTVEAGAAHRGKAAAALGRILLGGPIWSAVARAGRLVIVPDGALHYVPFAALPAPGLGGKPLLEHAEVDYLPSATTLAAQRRRPGHPVPAKWAAVFADPVFSADDPRLSRPSKTGPQPIFERLPASRREAEVIAGLAPPGQVWIARDLAADREAVLSADLRAYRVVHFATHAVADTRTPELSGLILSLVDAAGHPREGFLGLTDIYALDLPAGLVVLSGCRTSLGQEVRGEGLMGLTRGFLHAGVPRVVASLWPVQDRATSELMALFYRAMWREHQSPAAALRQAQRSMRRNPRYRDPFSWSGFVLQGDWR